MDFQNIFQCFRMKSGQKEIPSPVFPTHLDCSEMSALLFIFDSRYTATATIKGPLTNQMRLIYPISQSDAY